MKIKKIFIDSDVILDVVFEREPYFENSQQILNIIEQNIVAGYTSTLILANCYYIISNQKSILIAKKVINRLRSILNILPLTDKEIGESLNSQFTDFEDGVQYFICVNNKIETLITRNIKDYKKATIHVLTPSEYIVLVD